MASEPRDDFRKPVQTLLAQRAGFKCSAPFCRATTIGPGADLSRTVSVGVAAHITAAAPGGPRFDPNLTAEQRCDVTNGIWLCQTHARQIDVDATQYPASLLRDWRDNAEREAQGAVGKPEQQVGQTNSARAKTALARAARLPDALLALVEDILSLPNATIEYTYPGVENERGRKEAARNHSQKIREIRGDAEDALPVLGNSPELTDLVARLFTLETQVRGQIQSARVPSEQHVIATPEWRQLEEVAREIRRLST